MSLYYCWVTKMANAVVLWVLVYFCVTSVNTKDSYMYIANLKHMHGHIDRNIIIYEPFTSWITAIQKQPNYVCSVCWRYIYDIIQDKYLF